MDPTPRAPDFGEILECALALPSHEQARLCFVLQRLAGTAGAMVPLPLRELPSAPQPRHEQEDWLQSIQQESGWTQLQLLDDALAQSEPDEDVRPIELARERLLQAQPALAVRSAVVDLATRHPVGILLGAVGLVLAVVSLFRFAFRALF